MASLYAYSADVPPLEDMSEELEKIRTRGKRVKQQSDVVSPRQDNASSKSATASVTLNGSRNKEATKERSQTAVSKKETVAAPKSSFGGFKKGFLVSSSDSKPQAKKAPPPSKRKAPVAASSAEEAASSKASDIPFIRPKDKAKSSLEFPEVQQAMKEAFPLLQSKGG